MNAAPLSPDDPRLLAFALGEVADPAEHAALAAAVAADPVLAAAVDAHRAVAAELGAVFSKEPLPFVSPAAIAAKAMAGAPVGRRRSPGLGGSLVGARSSHSEKNRLLIFGGFGAAAAACVALLFLTRPHGHDGAASTLVANKEPVAAPGVTVKSSSSRVDLASLTRGMPGLAGAGVDFRPAGRAPLALSAGNARAYAAAFAKELSAGRRPVASLTRVDGLVNAFIATRHLAPGTRPVLVETALTDAPWDSARRLLRVTVRARGVTGEVVARNASASVDFDPAGVKGWRILGHEGAASPTVAVSLRGGDTVTTLYEIEPVEGVAFAGVAGVTVRYARADRPVAESVTAALTGADRKAFVDTDSDTRFAAGLAAYALNLGENPAAGLAAAAGSDPERVAFAALVR